MAIVIQRQKIWKKLNEFQKRSAKTYIEQILSNRFLGCRWGLPKEPSNNKKLYIKFTQKDKRSLKEVKQILEKNFSINCRSVRISEKIKNGIIWKFSITNMELLNFVIKLVHFIQKIG